jgi:hypothetical protein
VAFMTELAEGTFDITATRQPPYDSADGLVLGRTSFVKTCKAPKHWRRPPSHSVPSKGFRTGWRLG